MSAPTIDRRKFLGRTAATAMAAGCVLVRDPVSAAAAPKSGTLNPVRVGAPVFGAPQDPEELALAHRKLGYRAAYCPGVKLNDTERIRDISTGFAKHDVVIAEVGRCPP